MTQQRRAAGEAHDGLGERLFVAERLAPEVYFGHKVPIVRSVHHFQLIDSTNTHARRLIVGHDPSLLAEGVPMLIVAEAQTAGRGRNGRTWWTGPGSLAFTLVLNLAAFPVDEGQVVDLSPAGGHLGLATAVAIVRSLSALSQGLLVPVSLPREAEWENSDKLAADPPEAALQPSQRAGGPPFYLGIKWPNDVLLNGRKVAGILVELLPPGWAVIGVGVNTNCSLGSAPAEVQARATSIRDLTGTVVDHRKLLAQWLKEFATLGRELNRSPAAVAEEANRLCVHRDQPIRMRTGEEIVHGKCLGIAPDGALVLEQNGGKAFIYSGHVLD